MTPKTMKHPKVSALIFRIKRHLFRSWRWLRFYDPIADCTKINFNKIVFSNMCGHGYGGDPKYLAEYILENKLEYELVWLIDSRFCNNTSQFPEKIKVVELYSIQALHELASAFVWIDNARKFVHTHKKNNQIYIQTWHGTFPSKKIEKDAEDTLDGFYVETAKRDSGMIDYIVSGCQLKTKIYKESFYYNGPVLNIGTPKEDLFFDKNKVSENAYKVRKSYSIPKNNIIVLYAPTFRRNPDLSVYNMDYEKISKSFEEKFERKCTMLVRLHPNLTLYANSLKLPNYVINATTYPDMQELICAADAIISDYSSTLDYSIFDRPIFLYCTDLDIYLKNDRDFYIGINDQPFSIAKTSNELAVNILNFNLKEYLQELHKAYTKYGLFEKGTACKNIIKLIEIKKGEL